MTVLILKDGKRGNIGRDRHFIDLLREYRGDDAADFYENRIKAILEKVDEAREVACEGATNVENLKYITDILSEVQDE